MIKTRWSGNLNGYISVLRWKLQQHVIMFVYLTRKKYYQSGRLLRRDELFEHFVLIFVYVLIYKRVWIDFVDLMD